MKTKQENVIFQCSMLSGAMACVVAITIGLFAAAIWAILSLDDVSISVAMIAVCPMLAFALFLLFQLLLQPATVLTVTPNEVCLKRFGTTVTAFRREDVTSAGFFTRYDNKGQYLYLTVDLAAISEKDTLFRRIKKYANKKNGQYICVERTDKRTEAFKRLFPPFNESNDIRFPNA